MVVQNGIQKTVINVHKHILNII